MTPTIYVPGTCNIGPAEKKTRMQAGWFGLVATIVVFAALYFLHVVPWIRVVTALPAFVAAIGFLQAAFNFCVAFGTSGLYNISGDVGKTESVSQQEFRKKDQQKSTQIIIYAVLIAVIVGVLAVY